MAAGGRMFAHNYTPTKHPVNAFKAAVRLALRQAHRGAPLDGALGMFAMFLMPRPKRMMWKNKPMPRCPHTTKPDGENLLKALQDAMTGLAYRDDAQLCQVKLEKWIARGDEAPEVRVVIFEARAK